MNEERASKRNRRLISGFIYMEKVLAYVVDIDVIVSTISLFRASNRLRPEQLKKCARSQLAY